MPNTEEGIQARKTIESQRDAAEMKVREIVGRALTGAKVFLPAGSDEGGGNLRAAVQAAGEKALVRLFPRFDEADHASWSIVSKRVLDGSGDALGAVGYHGRAGEAPGLRGDPRVREGDRHEGHRRAAEVRGHRLRMAAGCG